MAASAVWWSCSTAPSPCLPVEEVRVFPTRDIAYSLRAEGRDEVTVGCGGNLVTKEHKLPGVALGQVNP